MKKDGFKELLLGKSIEGAIPSDELVGYLSLMAGILSDEGQKITPEVYSGTARLYVDPADIVIIAKYGQHDEKLEFRFHPGKMRDERPLWEEGKFGGWIQEALQYEKRIVRKDDFSGFNYHGYLQRLLEVSKYFYELYPKLEQVSMRLEKDYGELDMGARKDLREIVEQSLFGFKKEFLEILLEKSFKYSEEPIFKLVSGAMSNFYCNCKPATLGSRGMFLAGNLIFDAIADVEDLVAVGGLTFGADPIANSVSYTSQLKRKPINSFSIRKDQKAHGIIKWVEGDIHPGDRACVIDDVATTGGSTIKAIERARADGLDVVCVVILVDRQEGGIENIRQYVSDVRVIFKRDTLFSAYREKCLLSQANS
ncbi:MAG: orotate phosphoribosyltransferase [Candidatus Moraniibacteriota bacterium]